MGKRWNSRPYCIAAMNIIDTVMVRALALQGEEVSFLFALCATYFRFVCAFWTFSLFETYCHSAFFFAFLALCKVLAKTCDIHYDGVKAQLDENVVTEVIYFLFSHRLFICVNCLFVCAYLRPLVDWDSSGEESVNLTPILSTLADSLRNSTLYMFVQHKDWVLWRKIAVLLLDPTTHLAPETLINLLFWWY